MSECICEGNWRSIINESNNLMGRLFNDKNGDIHTFVGVMHCPDDYYYAMLSVWGEYRLLSCVGSLKGYGFELLVSSQHE